LVSVFRIATGVDVRAEYTNAPDRMDEAVEGFFHNLFRPKKRIGWIGVHTLSVSTVILRAS